ncbi:MAG: DUF503 domain-containing protein [Deltaproteobacteria bacterium]|nr:DUF503 domain-containing protein [Deltaproteobacteria bacterium]
MVIGTGIIELHIAECRSLKEKRSVVKKIIGRARNSFNVSIAEVGFQDSWKRALIGFCMAGNDRAFINSKMDKLVQFVENMNVADIIGSHMEITSMSDLMDGMDERYEF